MDRSLYKQGRHLPGTRIPIYHPDRIRETKPDYVIILPWNLKDEIMQQLQFIREWGGRFVVPIPKVSLLNEDFGKGGGRMKVVLFCGGAGMRLRGYSEDVPKPMVTIGARPVLWHVMKYYAHFGHKDFFVLGTKRTSSRTIFSNTKNRCPMILFSPRAGVKLEFMQRDIDDWKITFVDTGQLSTIGDRLRLVEPYLKGEEIFLANYSDGLTDFPLPQMIDEFSRRESYVSFLSVQPRSSSLDTVQLDEDGSVTAIKCMKDSNVWVNGGYFVLRKDVFRFLKPGEEFVYEPMQRMIAEGKVWSRRYEGFWQCMDTFKDKQILDELEASGTAPWCVWKNGCAGRVTA